MSPPQHLPTPRELLTNLITTLSSHPIDPNQSSTNPLQNAPSEIRSLLTTLHIIFPHLLLPALDLLDRQLVTKSCQLPSQTSAQKIPFSAMELPSSINGKEDTANSIYLVQSSQSTSRHRHQKSYTIRLHAWNCTCASFIFSAFPPSSSSSAAPTISPPLLHPPQNLEEDFGKWEFGGASLDGKDGGAVPACKHLLAVVLADRWSALRKMVQERWVGREEMAGLGAGF